MNPDKIIAVRKNKTVYRDGNLCLKVFGSDFSKGDILNEALNHARVEETGLNIPEIKEVTMIDGKWAIVTEFVEGKTLEELMREDAAGFDKYLEMFVDIQLKMHSKKCPMLSKLKDKMHAKINMTDFNATIRYDLHTRLEAMPNHKKLCHGDYNPSNIIMTGDGTPYIIDWSHATQGNASADAARTYLLFRLSGNDSGAKNYLRMFCEKSDTAIQYVQEWMPVVAASQTIKGNKNERELLNSWINVVDYD